MWLDVAYGREMNITLSGNSSGGHFCSQHANCTLPQNLRHLWRCVTKRHISSWPFIVPSTRCTCVMIMLFLSASWYATHVRWMDYLDKGEMVTNRDVNKCMHIWEKYTFVRMEHFCNLLFRLIKHWTNTSCCVLFFSRYIFTLHLLAVCGNVLLFTSTEDSQDVDPRELLESLGELILFLIDGPLTRWTPPPTKHPCVLHKLRSHWLNSGIRGFRA